MLVEERAVGPPRLRRPLGKRAADREEQLGRLAKHLVPQVDPCPCGQEEDRSGEDAKGHRQAPHGPQRPTRCAREPPNGRNPPRPSARPSNRTSRHAPPRLRDRSPARRRNGSSLSHATPACASSARIDHPKYI